MDEILAEFIAETREMLETISGEIVAWESDPGDRARLDAIFRFVHTVKGSCGFLDLPRLEALSHAAEGALSAVRDGARVPDRGLVSAILAIIDRISDIVEAVDRGEELAESNDAPLIAALDPDAAHDHVEARNGEGGLRAPARSIRVPVELLDRLMGSVSDIVLARNDLGRQLRRGTGDVETGAAFERVSALVAEMRDAITRMRMQRVEGLFAMVPRLVRDLAGELGKEVTLDLRGGDVELDREVIELLRDPLTHIVRNALDHGFETPAERIAAGKRASGALTIGARQAGNEIVIEISDDGRGIDADALLERAMAAGTVETRAGLAMSHARKLQLMFAAGLSTASEVSAVSGRGVGMDVVRANLERIGGAIEIESEPGIGTTIALNVPLTLTIIPALTASVGASRFAIPRSAIAEIVSMARGSAAIEAIGGGEMAVVRGERMPLVRLRDMLGLGGAGEHEDGVLVIVCPTRRERYALAVSAVHDHEELVVKPAAPALIATGVYAGTALPDSGEPLLLLDAGGIAERARIGFGESAPACATAEAVERDKTPTLLFRDLDGATRGVRLALVERIMDIGVARVMRAAGELRVAIDGAMLPVLASGALPKTGSARMLRMSDGAAELVYAIGEVIDVVAIDAGVAPARQAGRIAGVVLIDGAPVELIDAHYLFAEVADGRCAESARPVCLLRDGGDRWAREVLRPMIELAGYRIVGEGEGEPDVILEAGGQAAGGEEAAPVVRLRNAPSGEGDVYRYDRDGLLAALRASAGGK